jgi:glycosyltransferase involved in cell wall biosynthesis
MKMLQIGASWFAYQFSGLERYFCDLVTHLPALGADITALAYELKAPPRLAGLNVISLGSQDRHVAHKFFKQRRILKTYLNSSTDLVVSHCTPSLFPSLGHLGHKPLVCHFHGPRYLERAMEGANPMSVQVSKFIEQRVYARTDHVITLSQYMKNVLVANYRFPEEKISVIPGGVSLDRFRRQVSRTEARELLGIPPDRPVILTVRRLECRMGLENLIEAMTEVRKAHSDALLLIAGKGRLRQKLSAQIQSQNLSHNIRLVGAVADETLPLYYQAADFSIVPTIAYEGFGLILLESLASGTPVLGTPVGAIPEVLTPLSDLLLLENTTPHALANGIRGALSGHRTLPTPQQCETYAATNYDWSLIGSKVDAIYRQVVSRTH